MSRALTYKDSHIRRTIPVLLQIITAASAYSIISKKAASVVFTPSHSGENSGAGSPNFILARKGTQVFSFTGWTQTRIAFPCDSNREDMGGDLYKTLTHIEEILSIF